MSAAKSSNQSPIKPYNYSSYQMHGTTRGTCKCNKFLPQLFNANKCQQCFNLKDAHSVEALAEFSKSNRKVCKYSYLFIAPPDLELNKTKRWQWRFFIFHDDGELTYSLDDNPLTLPQGSINMCKCEEIIELNPSTINTSDSSNSDDTSSLSSYPNALRLRFSPHAKDIYIAAGNYEEIMKWKDILSIYCKRSVHKADSSPIKTIKMNKKLTSPKMNKQIDLNDFDAIDDINEIDEVNNENICDEDYDEEYDDNEPENEYVYEEKELTSMRINNNNDAKVNGDAGKREFYYDYQNNVVNCQSLSSSSSSSSSSNANRNKSETLKLKMVSGIKKSKSKNKLSKEKESLPSTSHLSLNEAVKSQDTNTSSSSSNETSINQESKETTKQQQVPDNNRRLSYKEDDLLRKQRLKDNLNQLLIEYKHEEEQHLKKSSKFSSLNSSSNKFNSRGSLDSNYPANKVSGYNKSSAFSLVVPPHQLHQQQQTSKHNTNSAFKPINSCNNPTTTEPIKIQTNKSKSTLMSKPSEPLNPKLTPIETSSSSQSSWTSTSSSSSSSSSKSPPKTRNIPVQHSGTSVSTDQSLNYKKPCLISPRKTLPGTDTFADLTQSGNLSNSSLNKGLKINVRQEKDILANTDEFDSQSRKHRIPKTSFGTLASNMAGYLWKQSGSESNEPEKFEKFWFSLNTSLCCLIYWNDKFEQDLGKFPIGKYELTKCCLATEFDESLEFKLTFHQNQNSLGLKATSMEKKASWLEAVRNTIDNISNICSKCKPKLIVNPMPLASQCAQQKSTLSTQIQSSNVTNNQIGALANQSEFYQQTDQKKDPNFFAQQNPNITSFQQLNQSKQNQLHFKQTLATKALPESASISDLTESSSSSTSSSSSSTTACSSSLSMPNSNETDFDSLRQHCEKLQKENAESTRKFKLLEQIHLDAVSEFDKQQSSVYHQLDEVTVKLNQSEMAQDKLNKKHEGMTEQIGSLNEQIAKYKEKCKLQENEISDLNKKIEGYNLSLSQIQQKHNLQDSSLPESSPNCGWNKEVKNLDARISDVLGKLRERELNLQSCSNGTQSDTESLWSKLEKTQAKLHDAQQKITGLSAQLKHQQQQNDSKASLAAARPSVNLQDFSDDLAKVLMSKEEVITSLEKQLKDKENHIQRLTDQLNEEISQANKFQEALNTEHEKNFALTNDLTSRQAEECTINEELISLRDQQYKVNTELESVQIKLAQSLIDNETLTIEIKNSTEFNRNEIDTLQEEIKTLEYKLVHSQRQAQEYQSILEDMDLSNTNTINFVQQAIASSGSLTPLVNEQEKSSSRNQNKLKQNHFQVQQLIQQVVFKKNKDVDEITNEVNKTRSELNLLREENAELNDHIYSIDVFMREKDQQCDQYQKEKDDLAFKLQEKFNEIENFNQTKAKGQKSDSSTSRQAIKNAKRSLNKLINFVSSSELMQFNSQIVSYMAEQLVHKSALNGNLKYACDMLRKKHSTAGSNDMISSKNSSSLLIECTSLVNTGCQQTSPITGKHHVDNSSDMNNSSYLTFDSSMQDEKIFKLASELLQSDDISLRKLSAQVLNEAQHLTQLNCILNTLCKIRWKHLKLKSNDKIENAMTDVYALCDSADSDTSDAESDEIDVDIQEVKSEDENLDLILNVIKDVFTQHKIQVSEQLDEVQKIMSISSDNDLLTHLQTENSILQQELQKYQNQSSDKKSTNNSNWLIGNSQSPSAVNSASSLRKFSYNSPSQCDKKLINQHILTDMHIHDDTVC